MKLTGKAGIVNRMCEYPWENRKVERLNGVIKNSYLAHRNIKNFEELKKEVDQTVLLYNQEKPHIELQRKSPNEFKKQCLCYEQQSSGSNITHESSVE